MSDYIIGRDSAYARLKELTDFIEGDDRTIRDAKEHIMRCVLEIRDGKWVDERSEELVTGLWKTEAETFPTFDLWLQDLAQRAGVVMADSTAYDKAQIVASLERAIPTLDRDSAIKLAVHHQGASKQIASHTKELADKYKNDRIIDDASDEDAIQGLVQDVLGMSNGKRSKQEVDRLLGKVGKLWFSFVKRINDGSLSFKADDRHIAIEAVYSGTPYQFALVFEKDAPDEAIRAVANKLSKKADI